MNNWRETFSWKVPEINVGDTVRVIATKEMLVGINVQSAAVLNHITRVNGIVHSIDPNIPWESIHATGSVRVDFQEKPGAPFFDRVWWFPLSVWQDYLEIIG